MNSYKIKVGLKGLNGKINRVFIVNDNITLDDLCTAIIRSMDGYLGHLYCLMYDWINYMSDKLDVVDYEDKFMGKMKLSKFNLEVNNKMVLWYDYGDDWYFNIDVKEVIDGHNDKMITLVKGKGKGILEDCGGIYVLKQIIETGEQLLDPNDEDYSEWYYDINDFNIDNINRELAKYYN